MPRSPHWCFFWMKKSLIKNGVLTSHTITIFSPFRSVSIYSMYLGSQLLGEFGFTLVSSSCIDIFIFLIYFIDYAITVVPFFSPLSHSNLHSHTLQHPPLLSSCPWDAHINSLASPFPILFLSSCCLFCTYKLCFLFPVPFSPISPLPIPTNNPPWHLHFCDSVPFLVVCLVFVFVF